MRHTKTLALLAAGTAIIGSSAFAMTKASPPAMVHISSTIDALVAQLDNAVQQELTHGCTAADQFGNKVLCGDSKTRIDVLHDEAARLADAAHARPAEQRTGALAAIHTFGGDGTFTYRSTTANPYTDDGSLIESYADTHGNEYWINPKNDIVVQMGAQSNTAAPPRTIGTENRLSVAELRARATTLASAAAPDFVSRRTTLHPLEDNKNKQIYFFRWDDFSSPVKESEMPAFIQVGLFADGTLASYTNTLTR